MKVAAQPQLWIKPGVLAELPAILRQEGISAPAVVTGGRSIRGREEWGVLTDALVGGNVDFLDITVRGEPSPEVVNTAVTDLRRDLPDCDGVVAIGGGSVIDAGKAIAAGMAMAGKGESAFDITRYLEGVGDLQPDGSTLPLIALPTTAGTGSEATKNAVLSSVGPEGFKKSLRHDRFVPRLAILDPRLHMGCPPGITVASGMDAITQLLESYLSPEANEITDALALQGLRAAGRAFPGLAGGDDSEELRRDMALAAYLSGVCLASAGLGVVHALASPLGALHAIPHGVVCALLVGPAMEGVIRAPAKDHRRGGIAARMAAAAEALGVPEDLPGWLRGCAQGLPRLSSYGFSPSEIPEIVRQGGLKNHPVTLDEGQCAALVEEVL